MNPQAFTLFRWVFVLALFWIIAKPSFALVPPPGGIQPVITPAGQVTTWAGALNGSYGLNGSGAPPGGASLGKDFTMPGPGGREAAARATVKLTAGQLAKAAARAGGYVGTALWAGSVIADYFDGFRAKGDGAGGLSHDAGQVEETVEQFQWCNGGLCSSSASGVYTEHFSTLRPNVPGAYQRLAPVVDSVSCASASSCTVYAHYTEKTWVGFQCGGGGAGWSCGSTVYDSISVSRSTTMVDRCPAYIDFSGNNIGAGSAPGADGKCATGTYEPLTAQELADIRTAHENAWNPGNLNDLMAEILGKVTIPIADTSGVEVGNVVPSSLPGPETTTTKVEDGDTRNTTEAVGWDWSLDPLRKDVGKWVETKTTTVRDGAGNVISETTTSSEGKTEGDLASEKGDMCALNPDAAACKALGEAPESDVLPEHSVAFEISPVAGFGPSTAACPAPRSITVSHGVTLSMPFDLMCEFADGIRPIVIAMAWIGAVFTFMGISRRQEA